jgi:hypothetical protein
MTMDAEPRTALLHGWCLGLLAMWMIACGGCGSSPSSTSGPAAPTSSRYAFAQIHGKVFDTAFRPLAGVAVLIVDGSQAGASAVSDTDGRFSFSGGEYVDGIRFRASKDGYVSTTVSGPLQFPPTSADANLNITLDSVAAPLKIESGAYTLTLIADSVCADIPSELRTRSYSATVAASRDNPNWLYLVDVSGPTLGGFGFGLSVAGQDLAFTIDGPAFGEHFPSFTYLEIAGQGHTSVETSSPSSITIPFSGSFQYCVLNSEMSRTNNCYTTPADQRIAYSQCLSQNDWMVHTRRLEPLCELVSTNAPGVDMDLTRLSRRATVCDVTG